MIFSKLLILVLRPLKISNELESENTLEYSGPNPGSGDVVFPKTPAGQQIKQHLTTAAGVGEDAEMKYQKSLLMEKLQKLNPMKER